MTTTTTTSTKPRWVECADKASDVLDAARDAADEHRDAVVREAYAWMQLACVYRDGKERNLEEVERSDPRKTHA